MKLKQDIKLTLPIVIFLGVGLAILITSCQPQPVLPASPPPSTALPSSSPTPLVTQATPSIITSPFPTFIIPTLNPSTPTSPAANLPFPTFVIPTMAPIKSTFYALPLENFPGVIGWEADKDGVIAYYDGSFYVRDGKNQRFAFSVFNEPASFQWYNAEGYLPCLVTEFERDGALVQIKNFGDLLTLNEQDYVAIYSRVVITNNGSQSLSLAPGPSAGLVPLTNNPTTVLPGKSIVHDFVVASDRFGNTYPWPSDTELANAGSWDEHYSHMKAYWNERLSSIVQISKLPDKRLIDAYKAGFIYTNIIRDGYDIHVGENGYDSVFDHDSLGILTTLFNLGDFTYDRPLLEALQAKTQYDDARYKNSWIWALYLLKTGDEAFVREHFAEIRSNTHYIETDLNAADGILNKTNDIDANGYWTVDDAAALFGLTTYQYLANRLGETSEADWARNLYAQLLQNVNQKLTKTMQTNRVDYIPCDITEPNTANRCGNPTDANWASMLLFGRWFWEGYLWGAEQNGPLLDKIDDTYTYGFDRLKNVLPAHTYGSYPGYSTTYNAGYGRSGLRGSSYRTEAILDFQFMLDKTQSSPFGWWESIEPPAESAWVGTHPSGGAGACPHMWGQSFATSALLDSLVAEKFDGTVIVGRGIPNGWVTPGQVIRLTNYPIAGNKRMGLRIEGLVNNEIRLTLTGDVPSGSVVFNLPLFINNIQSATAGVVDSTTGEVTLNPGTTVTSVRLVAFPQDSTSGLP